MQPILSYHGNPAIKTYHVDQAQHHFNLDMLVQGTYGITVNGLFGGCSIGCMARDLDPSRQDFHAVVAEAAGWPLWLVDMNDTMFERLPNALGKRFHITLREAIPVGVNLDPVWHHMAIRRMSRLLAIQAYHTGPVDTMRKEAHAKTKAALISVRRGHGAALRGEPWDWGTTALQAGEARECAYRAASKADNATLSAAMVIAARSAESAFWVAYGGGSPGLSADSAVEAIATAATVGYLKGYPGAVTDAWKIEVHDLLELLRMA